MDLEKRLMRRYHQLVRSHMLTSDLLSAGVKSSLKSNTAFSQTINVYAVTKNSVSRPTGRVIFNGDDRFRLSPSQTYKNKRKQTNEN